MNRTASPGVFAGLLVLAALAAAPDAASAADTPSFVVRNIELRGVRPRDVAYVRQYIDRLMSEK